MIHGSRMLRWPRAETGRNGKNIAGSASSTSVVVWLFIEISLFS